MISLRTHNVLDYVIGAVLVLCPYLFAYSGLDAARNTFLVLGFGLIAYSLITDYHYSIARIIPLGVHMTLDVVLGMALILSPWAFGYKAALTDFQFYLHWIMGLGAISLVMLTKPRGRIRAEAPEEITEIRRAG